MKRENLKKEYDAPESFALTDEQLDSVLGGVDYGTMITGAGSVADILKTLKEKVINAANDTNTDVDRAAIQKEMDQTIAQVDDNAFVTFNGKFLGDDVLF